MKCPACGSERVWRVGTVPTQKQGQRQRFKCAICAKTFYSDIEINPTLMALGMFYHPRPEGEQ